MCGTFYIDTDGIRRVSSVVDAIDQRLSDRSWDHDIHPTDYAPVMKNSSRGFLAALIDLVFVILQRYNRPRIMKIINR